MDDSLAVWFKYEGWGWEWDFREGEEFSKKNPKTPFQIWVQKSYQII